MSDALDLEREALRAAFERSIGRPRPGVEDRVLSGIPYDRREGVPGRLGWLAISGAVVLALLMVAALLVTRHGIGSRPLPASSASPHGRAPGFVYSASDNGGSLVSQPWDGSAQAPVPKLPSQPDYPGSRVKYLTASPDGHLLREGPTVYELGGKVLGRLPADGSLDFGRGDRAAYWGDDSRHICWMAGPLGNQGAQPGRLMIWQPGVSPREVARLGNFADPNEPAPYQDSGNTGLEKNRPMLRACSPTADRAVVQQLEVTPTGFQAVEAWVVKLSTGAVTMHRSYPPGRMGYLLASHDGRLLAETDPTTNTSLIVDTTSGATTNIGERGILAFSWDGTQVLAGSGRHSAGWTNLEVFDWRTGRTVWSAQPSAGPYRVAAGIPEPGGSRWLVDFYRGERPSEELWLIQADGRSTQVAANAVLHMAPP
jgi:hypothetical protein